MKDDIIIKTIIEDPIYGPPVYYCEYTSIKNKLDEKDLKKIIEKIGGYCKVNIVLFPKNEKKILGIYQLFFNKHSGKVNRLYRYKKANIKEIKKYDLSVQKFFIVNEFLEVEFMEAIFF